MFFRQLRHQMLGQQRQIFLAIFQRRQVNTNDIQAVKQIVAQRARRTASSGSRFVAARIRTSTGSSPLPPKRLKARSSITRNSFACNSAGISAISSSSSVPLVG